MFCNTVNQYQINIFSGSCDLDFDMGNISLMIFSLIEYIGFDFPFTAVTQFSGKCPFIMIKKLAVLTESHNSALKHLALGTSCYHHNHDPYKKLLFQREPRLVPWPQK